MRRQQVDCTDILRELQIDFALQGEEPAEISHRIKYEQYIARQDQQNAHLEHLEKVKLPKDVDYKAVHGLSSEAIEKLSRQQPENLSQASRISGVSPSDVSILMTWLKAGGYHGE